MRRLRASVYVMMLRNVNGFSGMETRPSDLLPRGTVDTDPRQPRDESVRGGEQNVAIGATRQLAVFHPRGAAKLLGEKQTADEQQKNHNNANQTCSLPVGHFLDVVPVDPMVMSVQRDLPPVQKPADFIMAHGMVKTREGCNYGSMHDLHRREPENRSQAFRTSELRVETTHYANMAVSLRSTMREGKLGA
jgi:hypothetical protein